MKIIRWFLSLFGLKKKKVEPVPAAAVGAPKLQEPYTVVRYEGPADQSHYEIVFKGRENGFSVSRLEIVGDRYTHQRRNDWDSLHLPEDEKTDEFGHGIYTYDASGTIEDVVVRDAWGDGINLGFVEPRVGLLRGATRDVTIRRAEVKNNRRNGMSIVGSKNILVEDSTFSGTHGNPKGPGAGIDFEPDIGREYPNDGITLRRLLVENNESFGIICDDSNRPSSFTGNVVIEDSTIRSSNKGWSLWLCYSHGENVVRNCRIYGPVAKLKNVRFEGCEFFHDGSYKQTPYAIDCFQPKNVSFSDCRVNGLPFSYDHPNVRFVY